MATHEDGPRLYTRGEARQLIERQFNSAVLKILDPIEIVDLRAAVLEGEDGNPPAIALVCESIGQMDLGWIEKSNVLRNTVFGQVAPVGV